MFQRDFILKEFHKSVGFPGGSDGKESACSVGDPGSIPGSGRSPGEGNGNPLQYSCLENPTDRRAWWATVHEVLKSQTRLSDFTYFHFTNLYFLMQFYPKQISPNSVQVKDCLKLWKSLACSLFRQKQRKYGFPGAISCWKLLPSCRKRLHTIFHNV